MKPHLRSRIDFEHWERYLSYRKLFEYLARAATTPIRVPQRSDREIPKAA
jgi:hypothetical protein